MIEMIIDLSFSSFVCAFLFFLKMEEIILTAMEESLRQHEASKWARKKYGLSDKCPIFPCRLRLPFFPLAQVMEITW